MKRFKMDLSKQIAITVSALLIVVNIVLGFVLVTQSKDTYRDLINNRMLDISNTAASMIDGDVLEKLTAEDKDTPEYKKINDALAVFQENIDLEYIYTIRDMGNKKFSFMVDPHPVDPGEFGQEIKYTDALYEASQGKAAVDKEPYTDDWGRFYSSYTPVFDSKGKVAGIVAVDFDADWYDRQFLAHTVSIVIGTALSVILGVTLIMLSTKSLRKKLITIEKEIDHVSVDIEELTREYSIETASLPESSGGINGLADRIHLVHEGIHSYINDTNRQASNLINALGSDCMGVFYVDLDKDEAICYIESEVISIFRKGMKFRYSDANVAFAEHYVAKEYRDHFLYAVSPESIREGLKNETVLSYRYLVKTEDTEFYAMIRIAGVRRKEDRDDGIVHAVGLSFSNVDAETRSDLERNRVLSDALMAAEEASTAKTAFLSNMSHEIRTPMNAIIGLNSLALKDETLNDSTREYLEKIGSSAKHLLRIINDILDMSRIESGRLVLRNEEFSFKGMLDQINTMVIAQCREKGLNYNCVEKNQIDSYYIGDDMKLKQILINILSNAIKFTNAPGDVTLSVEKTADYDGRAMLKFSVKDTGIGIDKEFLPKVFDSFTQENSSQSNKYGSTGLGMAITKSIVEMMNGTISVESEKGVGTEFTVVVTLKKDKRYFSPASSIQPGDLRVLIVDDDLDSGEYTRMMLNEAGIFADICSGGEEALHQLEIHHVKQEPYNLVLLDWKMAGMDGLEAAGRIRERYSDETSVIILTAYNWDDVLDEAMNRGVDGFLSKPLLVRNLVDEYERISRRGNAHLHNDKPRAELKGRRILMAEDMFINAEIMKEIIMSREAEIDYAENGRIALEMFRDSPAGYYDAILMDVRMPEMDGLEAAAAIRALDRRDAKLIPIIALTANAFDEDVQSSLQSGMNAHLSKPVEPEYLYQTLEELIYVFDEQRKDQA